MQILTLTLRVYVKMQKISNVYFGGWYFAEYRCRMIQHFTRQPISAFHSLIGINGKTTQSVHCILHYNWPCLGIAYSMGQIIKSVCIYQSLCPSVGLWALSRSHFLINFYRNWHRHKNPQRKNRVHLGVNIALSLPYFAPKIPILCQKVLKTHTNIK